MPLLPARARCHLDPELESQESSNGSPGAKKDLKLTQHTCIQPLTPATIPETKWIRRSFRISVYLFQLSWDILCPFPTLILSLLQDFLGIFVLTNNFSLKMEAGVRERERERGSPPILPTLPLFGFKFCPVTLSLVPCCASLLKGVRRDFWVSELRQCCLCRAPGTGYLSGSGTRWEPGVLGPEAVPPIPCSSPHFVQ